MSTPNRYEQQKALVVQQGQNLRKEAVHLGNIFRRKLAGRISMKTKEHKTGRINTSKLYNYKMSDEVFKTTEVKPVGLNHGITLLIDASGSMGGWKSQLVSRETLRLLLFCQNMRIPYQVFCFEGSSLWPITSSYLPNLQSRKQINNFISRFVREGSFIDALGGTPLEDSLHMLRNLVPMFVEDFKIDIHSLFLLTDGLSSFSRQSVLVNGRLYPIQNYCGMGNEVGPVIAYLRAASEQVNGNSFWFHLSDGDDGMQQIINSSPFFSKKVDKRGEKFYEGTGKIGVNGVLYLDGNTSPSKSFLTLLADNMNKRSVK